MTIFLMILKGIGITLLVILGILLLLILSVLFVPLRYQTKGKWDKALSMYAKVTWLLHIVTVLYIPGENGNTVIRIFGIPVYDKRRKTEKGKQISRKKKKIESKKHKKRKLHTPKSINKKTENSEKAENDINYSARRVDKHNVDQLEQTEKLSDATKDQQHESKNVEKENYVNNKKEKKKTDFISKFKYFLSFIKEKLTMLWKAIRNIEYTFKRLYDRMMSAVQRINFYKTLWEQPETKNAFEKSKKHIFRILKDIRPRKTIIHVTFGMEDPATTADILSVYSVLYPWIGNNVLVTPEFDDVKIYADFYIRGHITLYILACAVWTYLFDQDIKHFKKCLNKEEF